MTQSTVSIEQTTSRFGAFAGPATDATRTGNGKLSKNDTILLLQKLATDDAFRSQFERSPMAALVQLGLPHDTVVNCLSPQTLASKGAFEAVLRQLSSESAGACLGMIAPIVKLDFSRS